MMRHVTQTARYAARTTRVTRQIATWNQRMLIGSFALVLWAASVLALQAMRPDARGLMAGEGQQVQTDQ